MQQKPPAAKRPPKTTCAAPRQKTQPAKDEAQPTLLDEAHASVFTWLAKLYDGLVGPSPSLPAKSRTRRALMASLPYQDGTYPEQALHFVNAAFAFDAMDGFPAAPDDPNAIARPDPRHGRYPFLLSTIEQRWLKTMLAQPEARFLLPRDLRADLAKTLKDVRLFDLSLFERQQLAGDDLADEENIRVLQEAVIALRDGCAIELPRTPETAERAAKVAAKAPAVRMLLPLRLRYNFRTNRYSLIAMEAGKPPVRLHVDAMRGLQCGRVMPPPVRAAAEQSYQAFLRQHRRHVRLRLANRNNARERGFALFSGFDKHSYVERDGRLGGPCLLVLYYYDFDREDLLARLLSLGGDVTVLADEKNAEAARLREELLRRYQAALPYYAADLESAGENETPTTSSATSKKDA